MEGPSRVTSSRHTCSPPPSSRSPPAFGGPPTITVENHEQNRAYRVTAYTVPDVERPSAVDFPATTDDRRERVSFEAVYRTDDSDSRNVPVAIGDWNLQSGSSVCARPPALPSRSSPRRPHR